MKERPIPCPHQPPTRGDNIVSVAQGGTATPCATKQLLQLDRVLKKLYIYIYMHIYIYIYIYTPDQSITETTLDVHLHSWCAVGDLKKNAFTFGRWCHYAFTVTVSWCYAITQEWWFRVHFIHAESFSLSTKSKLDACCAVVWKRFEATFKLRPVIPIFERNEMTECPRKPRQPTTIWTPWHIQPFSVYIYLYLYFCFCRPNCGNALLLKFLWVLTDENIGFAAKNLND